MKRDWSHNSLIVKELASLYTDAGIDYGTRVLFKIASTWEGIKAAEVLRPGCLSTHTHYSPTDLGERRIPLQSDSAFRILSGSGLGAAVLGGNNFADDVRRSRVRRLA